MFVAVIMAVFFAVALAVSATGYDSLYYRTMVSKGRHHRQLQSSSCVDYTDAQVTAIGGSYGITSCMHVVGAGLCTGANSEVFAPM